MEFVVVVVVVVDDGDLNDSEGLQKRHSFSFRLPGERERERMNWHRIRELERDLFE